MPCATATILSTVQDVICMLQSLESWCCLHEVTGILHALEIATARSKVSTSVSAFFRYSTTLYRRFFSSYFADNERLERTGDCWMYPLLKKGSGLFSALWLRIPISVGLHAYCCSWTVGCYALLSTISPIKGVPFSRYSSYNSAQRWALSIWHQNTVIESYLSVEWRVQFSCLLRRIYCQL